jgi:hypothetical protein
MYAVAIRGVAQVALEASLTIGGATPYRTDYQCGFAIILTTPAVLMTAIIAFT